MQVTCQSGLAIPVDQLGMKRCGKRVAVTVAKQKSDIQAARRLHAELFLAQGYVDEADLVDGFIGSRVDPWVAASTYFLARDRKGACIGVCRQISSPTAAHLPTMRMKQLNRSVTRQLRRQMNGAVVEISALGVVPGADPFTATLLYSCMWAYSRYRHSAWVMSVHPMVWTHLTASLGPVLEVFGPTQWYMGSDVIPSVLWTDSTSSTIMKHAEGLPPGQSRRALPVLFPPNPTPRMR